MRRQVLPLTGLRGEENESSEADCGVAMNVVVALREIGNCNVEVESVRDCICGGGRDDQHCHLNPSAWSERAQDNSTSVRSSGSSFHLQAICKASAQCYSVRMGKGKEERFTRRREQIYCATKYSYTLFSSAFPFLPGRPVATFPHYLYMDCLCTVLVSLTNGTGKGKEYKRPAEAAS